MSNLNDRMPPQNVGLEMAVLGAILLDPEVLHDVIPILQIEDLYRDSHQVIYGVIRDLYAEGKPVDLLVLSEELRRLDLFDKVGGLETLAECANAAPIACNAGYHAQIIRQHAATRRMIAAASKVVAEGYANQHTSDEYINRSEAAIFAVRDARASEATIRSAHAVASAAMDRIQRTIDGQVSGIETGIEDLDRITGGLRGGQLVILAARPAVGKTACALGIANHAARREPVLFVTLEMSGEEMGERLLVLRSGVDGGKCQDPRRFATSDIHALGAAYESTRGLPIDFDDAPAQTVTEIAATARRMKARGGLGLIVVDYLQIVTPDDFRESRQEQVATITRRLKTLARQLNVPVLALAQLNRLVEQREEKRPRMSDLRESGQIEQDAHLVLLLHRPECYDPNDQPGTAEMIVAKNRNSAVGTIRMAFDKRTMTFRPLDLSLGDFGGVPAPPLTKPDRQLQFRESELN